MSVTMSAEPTKRWEDNGVFYGPFPGNKAVAYDWLKCRRYLKKTKGIKIYIPDSKSMTNNYDDPDGTCYYSIGWWEAEEKWTVWRNPIIKGQEPKPVTKSNNLDVLFSDQPSEEKKLRFETPVSNEALMQKLLEIQDYLFNRSEGARSQ